MRARNDNLTFRTSCSSAACASEHKLLFSRTTASKTSSATQGLGSAQGVASTTSTVYLRSMAAASLSESSPDLSGGQRLAKADHMPSVHGSSSCFGCV